jgi:chromosome segregation ATPase
MLKLKEKLDATLKRNYLPSQNEVMRLSREDKKLLGESEANILGRKQEIDLTHPLPRPAATPDRRQDIAAEPMLGSRGADQQPNDREIWAEELRTADERTKKFREQAEKLEKDLAEAQKVGTSWKKQLETREAEIRRLQGLYEGGQNLEKLAATHISEANDQLVQRLNNQIDFLNRENHKLQNELAICHPADRAAAAEAEAAQQRKVSQLLKKNEQIVSNVKELEKATDAAMREKAELQARLDTIEGECAGRVQAETQKAEALEKLVSSLESQLAELRKSAESSTHIKAAYTSDKRAYADALETAKADKVALTKANKDLDAQVSRLTIQLEEARNEVNVYKGKCANAAREVAMVQASVGRATADSKEQAEECVVLRKRIHELEGDVLGQKGDVSNLRFELERLGKQKAALEEQLASFKNESLRVRTEAEGTGVAVTRLEALYRSSKSEADMLKKDNEQLDQLLAQQKAKVTELDKQARANYLKLTSSEENFKTLQQEHKLLSDELSAKIAELRKTETSKLQLERKAGDNKGLEDQIAVLTAEAKAHVLEGARWNSERVGLQDRIAKLEGEIAGHKAGTQELEDQIRRLKAESLKLNQTIKQLEDDNAAVLARAAKMRTTEQDLQAHKTTLEAVQKKDVDLAKDLEATRLKLARAQDETERLRKRVEASTAQIAELTAENKARSEENLSLKMKLTETTSRAKSEEERTKDMHLQSQDAQQALLAERKDKDKLERDLRNLTKDLENSRAKEAILNEQIRKLKTLVESLDSTKEELVTRVKESTLGKREEESEKAGLVRQIEQLKAELAHARQEAADAKKSLLQLDATMDQLRAELDTKTEENERLKQEVPQRTKDAEQWRSKAEQQAAKEDTFARRVQERENEIRELRVKLQEMGKEFEDAKEVLYYKDKELAELTNDLQVLTKENQCVNAELVRVTEARDQLQKASEELQHQGKGAQQTLRAAELEREDILHSYKTVCEENERLHENLGLIANENKELVARLQELEKELYGRAIQLQGAEHSEHKHRAEVQALERQVTNLVKELERAQGAVHESEGTKQAILEDMENAKQVWA